MRHLLDMARRGKELANLANLEVAWAMLRASIALRGCEVGPRVRVYGPIRVDNLGRISVGGRCYFARGGVPTELICHRGGQIVIGDCVGLNYGVSLDCKRGIRIGARSMLGSFVRVADHARDRVGAVTIGEDVWIAHGAIIEPGVEIGDGAVVSAGSVVTTSIPPRTMAIGNPARAIPLDLSRTRHAVS